MKGMKKKKGGKNMSPALMKKMDSKMGSKMKATNKKGMKY